MTHSILLPAGSLVVGSHVTDSHYIPSSSAAVVQVSTAQGRVREGQRGHAGKCTIKVQQVKSIALLNTLLKQRLLRGSHAQNSRRGKLTTCRSPCGWTRRQYLQVGKHWGMSCTRACERWQDKPAATAACHMADQATAGRLRQPMNRRTSSSSHESTLTIEGGTTILPAAKALGYGVTDGREEQQDRQRRGHTGESHGNLRTSLFLRV